ncbi:hypothetical protein ONS95_001474 [Cadophora gregata]|uniref:uncharacterized protein n=1 Tax=Cadophora gregata TaxID=51156 RepID=UPI0026DBA989|nr:uncharacterized protein ONS95_001474 [Cadophora gregata]KAK0111096.1 hypothetical protein ONS95_001474 [Cadophora gregata]
MISSLLSPRELYLFRCVSCHDVLFLSVSKWSYYLSFVNLALGASNSLPLFTFGTVALYAGTIRHKFPLQKNVSYSSHFYVPLFHLSAPSSLIRRIINSALHSRSLESNFLGISKMLRQQVVLRVNGENGVDGSKHQTQNKASDGGELEAFQFLGSLAGLGALNSRMQGANGRHGRNATAASAGTPSGNVCVELSSSGKSGSMIVIGYGQSAGYRCEVPSGHNLFISARGGNGGDGGCGEGGQDGGDGMSGRDADEWHSGGQGGRGGDGGNAGYGTYGGNGGPGGNIEIRVHEDDMCLLLALDWDNSGGQGGSQGQHGMPGSGGRGGRGGRGHSSVERHDSRASDENPPRNSRSTRRHMPGGYPGSNGRDGAPARSILRGGTSGRDGKIRFVVMFNDGTVSKYASRYDLRIEHCMLKDENDDGIYEPGEQIMVQHIAVRNYGEMPSPSQSRIRIAITPSKWVDPTVDQKILRIQTSIPGFTTVQVSGTVRALIKPETELRLSPTPLKVDEAIRLEGIMSGINRKILGFGVTCPFVVQYPLRLNQPLFAEAVAHGEQFKIKWSIENISSRAHGIHSDFHRTVSTRISTDSDFVEFLGDEDNVVRSHEIHGINHLERLRFQQQFSVSEMAEPFSKGVVKLDLMLTPPTSTQDPIDTLSVRSSTQLPATVFNLEIQVSPKYQYNPSSSYLLLINSSTSEALIRHISNFIQHDLMLELDIFNTSLNASLNQESGQNILERYTGKTIVVPGNVFTFFGSIGRSMYEFMNPAVISKLLDKDTNFLFLDTQDFAGLTKTWGPMVASPVTTLDESGTDGSLHGLEMKPFLEILQNTVDESNTGIFKAHSVTAKKSCMRSEQRAINYRSKTLAKNLRMRHPNRNFTCRGISSDGSNDKLLSIMVHEALPLSARIYVSSKVCDWSSETLDPVLQYLIVASLPLAYRSKRIWGLASLHLSCDSSKENSSGFTPVNKKSSVDDLGYQKDKDEDNAANEGRNSGCEARFQEALIETFLQISVRYDLIQELSHFTKYGPWLFDPLRKHSLAPHLPRLTTFFNHSPDNGEHPSITATEYIEWFTSLLAELDVITAPKLLGKFYCRKAHLSKHLQHETKRSLSSHFGKTFIKIVQKAVKNRIPHIKEQHKALRKSPQKVSGVPTAVMASLGQLKEALGLPRTAQQPFVDLGLEWFQEYRTAVINQVKYNEMLNTTKQFEKKLAQDEERGRTIRRKLFGDGC